MRYRTDTKTDTPLSILGFGCMRFPRSRGKIDVAKSEALILDAVEQGVNYFDTAYVYPGSEEVLGHIVAKNNLRGKIFIATKLPLFLCKNYGDFDKFLNKSLERLQTNFIDYYLMHMITTPQQWQSLCDMGIEGWIDEKRAEGKIRQLGFSFHGKRDDYVKIIDARNWDFTMIQYNYLDINNQAGITGLRHAASKNIPVFIMEPLLGGRLAGARAMPENARAILTDGNLLPAARALRWVWNHKEVTLLLSGMSSKRDLDENLAAANSMPAPNTLSKDELDIIDRATVAFNEANKIPCTGCGYCVPCPQGVNIVDAFSCYNTSHIEGLFPSMKRYVQTTAALTTKKGLASACNACGRCESHCPQSIKIRAELKNVKKRLEPIWFRGGVSVARFFVGVKANSCGGR